MQSTLRFACAVDATNSHSADNFADARAATHSTWSHNTRPASTLAPAYSIPTAMRVSS